jgi:hypothetical protein
MSEFHLIERLLEKSLAKTWDAAVNEWRVVDSYRESDQVCLCGKVGIVECNTIRNMRTGADELVGSCCVKKFIPGEGGVVDGLRRITKNLSKSVGMGMIDYAFQEGWITSKDYDFYVDTVSKRKMSDAQLKW